MYVHIYRILRISTGVRENGFLSGSCRHTNEYTTYFSNGTKIAPSCSFFFPEMRANCVAPTDVLQLLNIPPNFPSRSRKNVTYAATWKGLKSIYFQGEFRFQFYPYRKLNLTKLYQFQSPRREIGIEDAFMSSLHSSSL